MFFAYLMYMKPTQYITAVLLLISGMLYGVSLESLIQSARTTSMDAYILELERMQAQADLALKDMVQLPSLTIENLSRIGSEERAFVPPTAVTAFTVTGAPTVTYNLHGDMKTEFEFGLSPLRYSFDLSDASAFDWRVTPSLKITQPLKHFFDDDSSIDDILYSIDYLNAELSYRRGMIDIDQMVLDVVYQGIDIDKKLADARYQKQKLVQDHERSLSIGTYAEGSQRARAAEQQIDAQQRTIESLMQNREFVVSEVQRITGLLIDQAPPIPRPDVQLEVSPLGNTTVLLSALAADLAEERLKEHVKDFWALEVSAGYGAGFSDSRPTNPAHSVNIGIGGGYKDLLLSAGFQADIGDRNTFMGTISGSWSIDGRRVEREITRGKLEIGVEAAKSRHLNAEAAYERRNKQLELEAASWNRSLSQLELREINSKQDLEDAKRAYERGIGSQRAVDDARHALEQIAFDRSLLYVNGWKLQRSIDSHLL